MQRGRTGKADCQPPALSPSCAAHYVGDAIHLGENAPRFFQQSLPGGGRTYASGQAFHQCNAEFGFQALQHPRQRWLLHSKPLSCAGDIAFLCDGNEGFELANFQHWHTFLVWEVANPGICSHG